jgi:hypothetical protein
MKFLDKINLQKYLDLIGSFLANEITANIFVEDFLRIRRDDVYWMTSSFDEEINQVMDAIFLNVDEYNPDGLYDPDDKFNIDEVELRKRLIDKLYILNRLTYRTP